MTMRVTIAGQTVEWLADPAAFWVETRTLVVADLHLGKAAALRQNGLPVPEGDTANDLDRLTAVLGKTGARRLIVAGDLFHAPCGYRPEIIAAVSAWRARHPDLSISLVTGNHDRELDALPKAWRLGVVRRRLVDGPFAFIHDPADADYFARARRPLLRVCGHRHPAIRLGRARLPAVKAPCFWLRPEMVVLPSFGRFTGTAAIVPDDGDRVFAIANGQVREVPAALWNERPRSLAATPVSG